jgi:cobalamin biosynthesis protein CobD/CbiB
MTYLVVPVLIVENVGPIAAIKRSASLLKKTWGEQIIGNFSIGIVFGIITLLVVLLSIPVFMLASASGSAVVMALVIAVVVLVVIFISLINATLSGIYVAAVYQYAATGETNSLFPQDLIKRAFRSK